MDIDGMIDCAKKYAGAPRRRAAAAACPALAAARSRPQALAKPTSGRMARLPPAVRRRLRRLVGHTTPPPSSASSSCRPSPKQGFCCAAAADAAAPQAVAPGHPCFVGEPEVAAFRRNGFHVLPAMLSPAEIERAATLFESVVAQGGGLRNLLDREAGLLFVAAHPTLLAAVHAILSPRPQILQYDGIDQLPGSSDQAYHADFSFFSSGVTLMLNVV
eukprot:SAG31_NODE_6844_length_1871_cov_2.947517_2_plen_217_part_00